MVMALLRRAVGEKVAFELVARGERITQDEAHRLGLVNRVFAATEFDDEVARYAHDLAQRSASAIALTKRLLYGMDGLSFEEAIARGAEVNALARSTDDCRAGVRGSSSGSRSREKMPGLRLDRSRRDPDIWLGQKMLDRRHDAHCRILRRHCPRRAGAVQGAATRGSHLGRTHQAAAPSGRVRHAAAHPAPLPVRACPGAAPTRVSRAGTPHDGKMTPRPLSPWHARRSTHRAVRR
jgi:hypothetical protein